MCSDSSKVRYLKRKFYESRSRMEEGLLFLSEGAFKEDQNIGESSQLS